MTEQQRIQQSATGRKKEEGEKQLLESGEQQIAQAETALDAAEAAMDDILADFTLAEGPTEVIGSVGSAKHPPLRQTSSEDFIRSFRQKTGQ